MLEDGMLVDGEMRVGPVHPRSLERAARRTAFRRVMNDPERAADITSTGSGNWHPGCERAFRHVVSSAGSDHPLQSRDHDRSSVTSTLVATYQPTADRAEAF